MRFLFEMFVCDDIAFKHTYIPTHIIYTTLYIPVSYIFTNRHASWFVCLYKES